MADSLPKYEQFYREGRDVCGPPFAQIAAFFDDFDREHGRVLDLGCGQGRDALLIARHGHAVVGVDLAETGIAQMLEDARKEGLEVEGVVADIAGYQPDGEFDVIVLDRVLHMLPDNSHRTAVLETACRHTRPGGFILIADTPKNKPALAKFFKDRADGWEKRLDDKGFLFFQRRQV